MTSCPFDYFEELRNFEVTNIRKYVKSYLKVRKIPAIILQIVHNQDTVKFPLKHQKDNICTNIKSLILSTHAFCYKSIKYV